MKAHVPSAKKVRNGKIEFLRFLFSIIIVIHHSRSFLGDDISPFLGGSLAVEFFFFVSGYLMMATVEKKNQVGRPDKIGAETAGYIYKKWISVLPESLIAWIIGFFVICFTEHTGLRDMIVRFIDSVWEPFLFTMTGLGRRGINGVVWYVSAMLICMALLYPLLRKYQDIMLHLVIPLTSLCILGYFCRNFSSARGPTNWLGWTYKGVLRAYAELGIGCLLYYFAKKIRSMEYTRLGQWMITVAESILYLAAIYFMYLMGANQHDYFFIALLAFAVALTFSGSGADSHWFDHRIIMWLGRFSVPLYFGHTFWATAMKDLTSSGTSITIRMAIYISISCITALLVMWLANIIRKFGPTVLRKIKEHLIA